MGGDWCAVGRADGFPVGPHLHTSVTVPAWGVVGPRRTSAWAVCAHGTSGTHTAPPRTPNTWRGRTQAPSCLMFSSAPARSPLAPASRLTPEPPPLSPNSFLACCPPSPHPSSLLPRPPIRHLPAGNILIGPRGRVGLLDYGQSKQLPDDKRVAFARLVLALNRWGGGARLKANGGCVGKVCSRQFGGLGSDWRTCVGGWGEKREQLLGGKGFGARCAGFMHR